MSEIVTSSRTFSRSTAGTAAKNVRQIVGSMTLEEKVGQCFIFGFGGTIITPDILESISDLHVGGIRLSPFTTRFSSFSDKDVCPEYVDSPDFLLRRGKLISTDVAPHYSSAEFSALLNRLQEQALARPSGIPLHFTVDQEGDFSSDYNPGFINLFPSQMGLASCADPSYARQAAFVTARQLRAAGIHWVNSPVVDVNINPKNPEIGTRSFGDDPEVVAGYASAMIEGFREGGVVATAKHFPGRGDSETDAHRDLPLLEASRSRLDSCELVPYRRLIAEGVEAIMIGHVVCPVLEPDGLPATISPRILKGLLREELGYDGLIVSDSITKRAIISRYTVPDACAMALQAGCDVVLMKAENGWRSQALYRVTRWVEIGKIPESELDRKVERILELKNRLNLLSGTALIDPARADDPVRLTGNRAAAERIAADSVILVKDDSKLLPLSSSSRLLLIEQKLTFRTPNNIHHHPRMLFEEMSKFNTPVDYLDIELNPTDSDRKRIEEALKIGQYDAVVMTNLYWRDVEWSDYLWNLAGSGLPVILITNTPYESGLNRQAGCVLINFGTNRIGYCAVCNILFGKKQARGVWPLKTLLPE